MENEEQMPKDHGLDHSLTLANEGGEFIINRRPSFNRNVFDTILLVQKANGLNGGEGAKRLYDDTRFRRCY